MPVTDDYPEGESNKFNGKLNWVRIDLEQDDVSHLEPEEPKKLEPDLTGFAFQRTGAGKPGRS